MRLRAKDAARGLPAGLLPVVRNPVGLSRSVSETTLCLPLFFIAETTQYSLVEMFISYFIGFCNFCNTNRILFRACAIAYLCINVYIYMSAH